MRLLKISVVFMMALLLMTATVADAGIVTTTDPSKAAEIGTRIRWGVTGFEASIFDNLPTLNQTPTLNPVGTPVWGLGNANKFQVSFNYATGTLGLNIDFNRDGDYLDSQESASRNVFVGQTSYLGYGFNYLSISGNEGGSTARSTLNNLVINGTSLTSLSPGGLFLEQFYKESSGNPMALITITGDLTFSTSGTAQERPSWNFNFKDAVPVSPSPPPFGS